MSTFAKLRSSFPRTSYTTQCSFNSIAVFLLIPLLSFSSTLAIGIIFVPVHGQHESSPPSDSLVSALIHGHLSYLDELPVSSYSRRQKRNARKIGEDTIRLGPSHKLTLIENLVYTPTREDKETANMVERSCLLDNIVNDPASRIGMLELSEPTDRRFAATLKSIRVSWRILETSGIELDFRGF